MNPKKAKPCPSESVEPRIILSIPEYIGCLVILYGPFVTNSCPSLTSASVAHIFPKTKRDHNVYAVDTTNTNLT